MSVATLLRRTNAANLRRAEMGLARKAELLARCRALMAAGIFAPGSREIADRQHQHVINHFGCLSGIYEQALDDATARAIAHRVMRRNCDDVLSIEEMHHLARAAVFGRVSS